MAKFKFIKRSIGALPCPDRRIIHTDTESKTLKLYHLPSDSKIFYFKKKMQGKTIEIRIAPFPSNIEDARLIANNYSIQIAQGIDPRKPKNGILTTDELFDMYLEQHLKINGVGRSVSDAEGYYKRELKNDFGKVDIKKIENLKVRKFFTELYKEKGYSTHNKVLNLFKAMMNKAIYWKLLSSTPITVKKAPDVKRERYLLPEETVSFFKALRDESREWFKDYVYLSLLTGARQTNVLSMKWEDVSIPQANWHIPITKNGESLNVPLVPEAVELLKNKRHEGEYVFQSSTSKYGYYIGVDRPWKELLERAGIANLRLHDLRRSLGSWQANLGTSLNIIGKSLGHKNVSTTAIYARLQTDPVRQSMEKATSAMLEAGNQKKAAKVVAIK